MARKPTAAEATETAAADIAAVIKPEATPELEAGDVSSLSLASYGHTTESLAKLDETDPVAAANIRSQLAWLNDAKNIFVEEDAATKRRKQMLADLSEIDARNAAEQRKRDEEKAAAERKANAEALKAEAEARIAAANAAIEAAKADIAALAEG